MEGQLLVKNLSIAFLAFIFYSIIGWAYECTIWAKAEKKRFMNRGMLLGPICPIYGLVSFLDWVMLNRFENPVVIFVVAAVVCCIFEYFVSWSLEKIFHQRWWDYSNYPLNLNGRISLPSGLFFGAAGLFLVKIVHPFTIRTISLLPDRWLFITAGVLAFILLVDMLVTGISLGLKNPPRRIRKIYDSIFYRTALPFEYLNEAVVPLDRYTEKMIRNAKIQARRMEKQMRESGEKIKDKIKIFASEGE